MSPGTARGLSNPEILFRSWLLSVLFDPCPVFSVCLYFEYYSSTYYLTPSTQKSPVTLSHSIHTQNPVIILQKRKQVLNDLPKVTQGVPKLEFVEMQTD